MTDARAESGARPAGSAGLAELDGAGLLIPALQPEPFRIQPVEPSPCTQACPAGINVKSYVSLIAEGRFAEALEVVREHCPLPGICGRICHHPCETACKRCEIDQPIAIRALKRFIADLELELPPPEPPPPPDKTDRVAVIGSGPAGLTAAYDLRLAGYPVTVFEAAPEAGGMLRYGIADYRLPTDVLDKEISVLTRAGIEVRTECRIGSGEELENLLGDYAAALFAVGAQRGRRLGLEGEDECSEIEDALSFLRRVNAEDHTPVAGRVLVIGGGSTAIEAARAALRLGAETVEIVYRRHRGEMPADEEEIEIAAEEGVAFRLLTAPAGIVTGSQGKLEGLECLEVALGEPDASGRRRPIPIPGSEFVIEADRIFAAIGQEAVLDFLPERVAKSVTERGLIHVDPETAMTAMHGIFAAGDVVTGPSTVIDAIAAGHRAAEAMRHFLEEGSPRAAADESRSGKEVEYEIPAPAPVPARRRQPVHAGIVSGREFDEVEFAFTPEAAVAEAQRCMRCGPCSECLICAASCGRRHITLRHNEDEAGAGEFTTLLRAPARIAVGLESGGEDAGGWLLGAADWGRSPRDLDLTVDRAVDLAPNRITIETDYCRGCARCIEVCAFEAIGLVDPKASETTVSVDPALCRGCNLCVAVCPTDAAVPSTVAPGWWGTRFEDLYSPLLATASRSPLVVFACQRRVESVRKSLADHQLSPSDTHLVPVRCAGQLDAGVLLELYRHGAGGFLIAGCVTGSCRYGFGPQLAAEQVLRMRKLLTTLGADPERVVADWAGEGDKEPLDLRMLGIVPEAAQAAPVAIDQSDTVRSRET